MTYSMCLLWLVSLSINCAATERNQITTIIAMGLILAAKEYGLGRHILTLDPARAAYCVKLLRVCEFFMIFATIFLKISISLFLKRLL